MSAHKNKPSGKFHKERGIQHARSKASISPGKVCGTDCGRKVGQGSQAGLFQRTQTRKNLCDESLSGEMNGKGRKNMESNGSISYRCLFYGRRPVLR